MATLKRMVEISVKRFVRQSFLLPVWLFWAFVAGRYEPFKSHFWLLLCVILSTVAALVCAFFIIWLWKKRKLSRENELLRD
jgi:hypothetical protein